MFSSRIHAGQQLAQELVKRQVQADLVLGIARGGVVVAIEVAKTLKLPLDVLVVKKLGAPRNPELAIGALTYGDVTYIDEDLVRRLTVDKMFVVEEVKKKHHEFLKREKQMRNGKPQPRVVNERVVLVDDGIATGATVIAAVQWLRQQKARTITLALPVAPQQIVSVLVSLVDEYVILEEPENFHAVGEFYKDFQEVTDEEVKNLLGSRG